MAEMAPKVSIMILNYNGIKWLQRCISSITKTDYPNFDVYLVDNGSTDKSLDFVRTNFSWVKIIHYPYNLGFSKAYNKAIETTKADYIVLLNNDTEILEKNWIVDLVEWAKKDENIAAVTCKLVSMTEKPYIDSVGGIGIPFWRGFVDIGRNELDQGQYDDENFEPFSFCGGAALIKRALFLRLGGFDEKFYMYIEDVDLSWRFRLLKYKIALASNAKVAHYFSGSSRDEAAEARRFYFCHKNLLRAILKNCGHSLRWALKNYILFSIFLLIGYGFLEPRKAIAVAKTIKWNLKNFKDTYSRRLRIQSSRKEDERIILERMYLRIKRYQPAERPKLRKILNILFEHSKSQTKQRVHTS